MSNNDTTSAVDWLRAQKATIQAMCSIAGVAGASVGVLDRGEVIFTHHYGFKDITTKEKANADTMYGVGSCSKSFFNIAAAALVDEGKLDWEEPVKTYVPEFKTSSQVVTEGANIVDLMAHRLGLSGAFHLAFQGDGEHLIPKRDFWKYLPKLQPVAPFRARWLYNSHGYSVLGEILERVTDKTTDECLQEYVARPCGLKRTVSELDFEKTENLAKPHAALANASLYPLPHRQDFRGHFFEAAAGVYTTLNDVLKYSFEVLKACSKLPLQAEGTIKESDQIFTQHIPVINPSFRERSYALGWIRTQLPGVVGVMGDNHRILPMDSLPIIGKGTKSRLALYHQGATVGYFPSFYLFPETQSAVVVLTNSIANCDAADWIAQAMAEALFDDQAAVDWIGLTRKFSLQCLKYYDDMQFQVMKNRQDGPPSRDISEYIGEYYDKTGLFFIRIDRKEGQRNALQLAFQGLEKQAYDLRYFYGDTFEWTLTRDQTAKRGRYHQFDQSYFNLEFRASKGDSIDSLGWRHDPNLPDPEIFSKK